MDGQSNPTRNRKLAHCESLQAVLRTGLSLKELMSKAHSADKVSWEEILGDCLLLKQTCRAAFQSTSQFSASSFTHFVSLPYAVNVTMGQKSNLQEVRLCKELVQRGLVCVRCSPKDAARDGRLNVVFYAGDAKIQLGRDGLQPTDWFVKDVLIFRAKGEAKCALSAPALKFALETVAGIPPHEGVPFRIIPVPIANRADLRLLVNFSDQNISFAVPPKHVGRDSVATPDKNRERWARPRATPRRPVPSIMEFIFAPPHPDASDMFPPSPAPPPPSRQQDLVLMPDLDLVWTPSLKMRRIEEEQQKETIASYEVEAQMPEPVSPNVERNCSLEPHVVPNFIALPASESCASDDLKNPDSAHAQPYMFVGLEDCGSSSDETTIRVQAKRPYEEVQNGRNMSGLLEEATVYPSAGYESVDVCVPSIAYMIDSAKEIRDYENTFSDSFP
eukprot:TRINITY_DN477_c0_g1_i10.p1 TRINITY_DN477_c0_g1~~TRINITY_DN477_c0_g1_i10.p1  ORF type:complete len:446 (+),score=65.74 TRINITY_DN477_c0_g1_i10:103-1440(+)